MSNSLKNLLCALALFIIIIIFAMAIGLRQAPAAEPAGKLPKGDSEIPAAAMGHAVPPLASFGVMQCGEVVAIWVVLQDKSVLRTDATHHPDTVEEYDAFLNWLKGAQSDIYEIPCKAAK